METERTPILLITHTKDGYILQEVGHDDKNNIDFYQCPKCGATFMVGEINEQSVNQVPLSDQEQQPEVSHQSARKKAVKSAQTSTHQ
jgi:Zn-finger nucleic acid-binding protein